MFESCYTPIDIVHLLRFRYGLPAILTADRPAVQCDSRIGAVDMPADLGDRVLRLLGNHDNAPVVANSRNTVWTFLVAPPSYRAVLDAHRLRRLADHAITVRRPGQRVLLPMSDKGFGWHWAAEPTPGRLCLLPCSAILDAIDTLHDEMPEDRIDTIDCLLG